MFARCELFYTTVPLCGPAFALSVCSPSFVSTVQCRSEAALCHGPRFLNLFVSQWTHGEFDMQELNRYLVKRTLAIKGNNRGFVQRDHPSKNT